MKDFDAVVIGGGQSGPFLAAKLAGSGKRVAVIERAELGGTCVNRGCTPTKTLRKSARVAHIARRASDFGVRTGPIEVDFAAAMERMNARVEASRSGLTQWLTQLDGLDVIQGHGRLAGRDGARFLVDVEQQGHTTRVTAETIYLNTGTHAFVPPIPGLGEVGALTNSELLQLRECPTSLVILGGSYIGLEMGQIFRRLGAEVTIIEAGPRIVSREDEDVSQALREVLEAEGITVRTGVSVERVRRSEHVEVVLDDGSVVTGSHLLVATGRRPNTHDLGLDTIGLATNARGNIDTNGRLETSVAGVFALGDINGRGAFTHTSYHDQQVVWANLQGDDRSVDDRTMTYALFTDPPLGHVGIHAAKARELANSGRQISLARISMSDVSRAKEESETAGLMKVWVDDESGAILGATLLGLQADEIVQVIGVAIESGATVDDLIWALPVHPTVTEFFPTMLMNRKSVTSDIQ